MNLLLSIFPGADLLGKGFEAEGFCVVRGPEKIMGGDVREFRAPAGHFAGVIGGPPCQDFSLANRTRGEGDGLELLGEFARVVGEAAPEWFLCENVPQVPTLEIPGYVIQRFNVNPRDFGMEQNRLRSFQFGSRDGVGLVLDRRARVTEMDALGFTTARHVTAKLPFNPDARAVLASEGRRKDRRTFADVCELQGLPRDFLADQSHGPGLSRALKYHLVGNGSIPVRLSRVIARAVTDRHATRAVRVCACQCGQPVAPGHTLADAACRKRMSRAGRVTHRGGAAVAGSQMALV